jgi:hypothetical protein
MYRFFGLPIAATRCEAFGRFRVSSGRFKASRYAFLAARAGYSNPIESRVFQSSGQAMHNPPDSYCC